jgi:hypothetical protein
MNTDKEKVEMLALIQQNSIRISNLEEKYNKFQCVYTKLEKHDETLLLHDQRMQTIMKKLLELHTDLQNLASVRQHIMTAFAALGGAVAAYLIHFLPHL